MGGSVYDFSEEAALTDEELQQEIDRLRPIPESELKAYLPKRADRDQLKDLIEAVNAETETNRKVARLNERLSQVAPIVKEVVLKILKGAICFPL